MKYFVLVVFILFLSGCDYKKVDEGEAKSAPTMKCGAGKCGAAMNAKKPKPKEKQEAKPAMKCGAGKCGSSMK